MAKQSLKSYLNDALKKKGMSAKEAQKNAGKYSSIKAAKAAGSLYYTNKKGQVMAAVYAEDLKTKLGSPASSKITVTSLNDKPGARDEVIPPERKKRRGGADPLNLAGRGGRGTGLNKGGTIMKKTAAKMNKGGMPMVMKNGKKVPAYAADGVGKMNMGGMAKKKPTAKMMGGGMAKKKPAAKMMAGGMSKKSGYMYGGMAKKKPAAKKK